jgi:hypothetical protein
VLRLFKRKPLLILDMDTYYEQPLCSFKNFKPNLGSYYEKVQKLYNPSNDICVKDNDGTLLFILKKQAISVQNIENTTRHYLPIMKKMKSTNRGFASGNKERQIHANYERSNPVHSTVAGYIDSPNNKMPCRLSHFSKIHFEKYQEGIPMMKDVDQLFKATLPDKYNNQYEKATKTKFRIEETAFTTITINYNFQTALHVDKGDCKQGFGVLVVSGDDTCGGALLFPRYNIGVLVTTGDVLFMNVHEYHCNSSVIGERLSFVFYLRNRLLDCSQNSLLDELGVDGKYWDTSLLITKIMEKISDTERFTFISKNRQYKLFDIKTKKRITNLQNIWVYLIEQSIDIDFQPES